jgi:cellulose synthase/poly-beta-1,6-N-acetylglucosamine synthase-like glycosyltransferase
LVILDVLVAALVAAVVIRLAVLLGMAGLRGRRTHVGHDYGAAIDVVVPAFEEQATLETTVRAILASRCPVRVIVVDDGSQDGTRAVAEALCADPRVSLKVHAHNRGKVAALRTGIAAATGPLVATVDADTRPDRDAIPRMVASLTRRNAAGAASNVLVLDRRSALGVAQSLEYVAGLHLSRRALAFLGGFATVPGATAVWRRSALDAVGGFSADTLAEDTDLSLTLQRAGHRVVFVDDAVVRTEAPATLRALFAQRRRWLSGNLQCAFKHRGVAGSRTLLGSVVWPELVYTHSLAYLLPLVVGLWLPWGVHRWGASWLLAAGIGLLALDLLATAFAYRVDRQELRELWHAPWVRLLFPAFHLAVFCSVAVSRLRGTQVVWRRERSSDGQGNQGQGGQGTLRQRGGWHRVLGGGGSVSTRPEADRTEGG